MILRIILEENLYEGAEPANAGPFILSNELKQQRLDICSDLSGKVRQNNAFFWEIVTNSEIQYFLPTPKMK